MRVIRAAGVTKLRDDAGTYRTLRLQPSYGEASCDAKRQVERKIAPESFWRTCLAPSLSARSLPPRSSPAVPRRDDLRPLLQQVRGECVAQVVAARLDPCGLCVALHLLLHRLDR